MGCVATEEVVTIYTDINPTAKDPIDVHVVYRGKQIKEEDWFTSVPLPVVWSRHHYLLMTDQVLVVSSIR